MNWSDQAERLAGEVTRPTSSWREAVLTTPRHLLVPRWWSSSASGWTLRDGPSDEPAWLAAAYSDTSLVTRVGPLHADLAMPGDRPWGRPTSSATLPGLLVRMFGHADVYDGADVLDVGVGSGYGCALLTKRLGGDRVTGVDVDSYVAEVAAERLDGLGLRPRISTCDATGPLPGEYDRIVATVSVRPIPASWLSALKPGGRLVTTITDTTIIIVADKTEDGGAAGQVQWDRAGFMGTRSGPDYPPSPWREFDLLRDREGEQVAKGRYPVTNVQEAWELQSMLEVTTPGIKHYYQEDEDGRRTAWMVHADGSWARAGALKDEPPVVHQGGPRRLWDALDEVRHRWLVEGSLPLLGAWVYVDPTGEINLARGSWRARIT